MIEPGNRYKLKASGREFDVLSMSKSKRHATIKFRGDRDEIKLSTSDIESAIRQDQVAAENSAPTPNAISFPGWPVVSPLSIFGFGKTIRWAVDPSDWIIVEGTNDGE